MLDVIKTMLKDKDLRYAGTQALYTLLKQSEVVIDDPELISMFITMFEANQLNADEYALYCYSILQEDLDKVKKATTMYLKHVYSQYQTAGVRVCMEFGWHDLMFKSLAENTGVDYMVYQDVVKYMADQYAD